MRRRGWAIAITVFWIGMNILLWRMESRGGGSAEVPLATVAQRLLEAADASTLEILQDGRRIGQLRWTPSVLQDEASATNALADEGMVRRRTGYAVDVELQLLAPETPFRGRGTGRCEFGADGAWRSVELHFTRKPVTHSVYLATTGARLTIRVLQDADVLLDQTLDRDDPQAAFRLLEESLGGLGWIAPGLLALLPPGLRPSPTPAAGRADAPLPPTILRWTARSTHLRVSQQDVRTYRVTARFLDRHDFDAWVGRGGQLLRVLLPAGVELREENLPPQR